MIDMVVATLTRYILIYQSVLAGFATKSFKIIFKIIFLRFYIRFCWILSSKATF